MLVISGDLSIEAPTGGRIEITETTGEILKVICSDGATARAAFQSLRKVYPAAFSLRKIGRLSNPLHQQIQIIIAGRKLLEWRVGEFPRLKSLRGLLNILLDR